MFNSIIPTKNQIYNFYFKEAKEKNKVFSAFGLLEEKYIDLLLIAKLGILENEYLFILDAEKIFKFFNSENIKHTNILLADIINDLDYTQRLNPYRLLYDINYLNQESLKQPDSLTDKQIQFVKLVEDEQKKLLYAINQFKENQFKQRLLEIEEAKKTKKSKDKRW